MSKSIREMSSEMRTAMDWDEYMGVIPFITLPEGYATKPMPPYGGAMVRFVVRKNSNPGEAVSVYLDCHNSLGIEDASYWEIYPDIDGECSRFDMDDVEALTQAIVTSLEKDE